MNLFFEPSLEELCTPCIVQPSPPRSLAPSLSFDLGVYDVHFTKCPHPAVRSRPTAAQKAGLRYETRAKEYLRSVCKDFVSGPWISYRRMADHQRRFCQPDGYVFESGGLTIFEIKYRWCADAATQLALYRAALGVLLSPRVTRCVCVTRSFDPAVRFEGRAVFIDEPLGGAANDSIGVLIWR